MSEQAGGERPDVEQPDPEASSDGDASWTDDPQTQDPGVDRSVDAVIERDAAVTDEDVLLGDAVDEAASPRGEG